MSYEFQAMFSFSLFWLYLKQNSVLCYFTSRQVACSERARIANCSHQRAPKQDKIQQVTEFHSLVRHVLCHRRSSSLSDRANQEQTLLLCCVPQAGHTQSCCARVVEIIRAMSPCSRSADPAVATRRSSSC